MLRLRPQLQIRVRHIHRQVQVSVHGFVGQFGIQHQAGNIDLIIDALRQIDGHLALHRRGLRIYPFSLRTYLAFQLHAGTVFEERGRVHLLDVHQHVIGLVVNIIESFQPRLVALKIGVSGHVHPHRLQAQLCASQVCLRPERVGAGGKPVRCDQIGVQVHHRIAFNRVERQAQRPDRKRGVSDLQATGIVAVAADIRRQIRVQGAGPDVQPRRIEYEPHIAELTVRDVKGHRDSRRVLFLFGRGVAQFDANKRIRQLQTVQREIPFRDVESRTLCTQMFHDGVDAHGGYQGVGMKRRLFQKQLVHHDCPGGEICIRHPDSWFHHVAFQAQSLHVNERVLPAMTHIETVYFYVHRQVFFALVGAVENLRRMVERREIEPSQVHVPVGPLVDLLHGSAQDGRAGSGRHQDHRCRNQ